MSEDTPKFWKKCEKLRKISPTWPQDPPKGRGSKISPACAMPCLAPNLEFKKTYHYLRWSCLTRGGVGPPRIVTLRGSARGSILENLPQHGEIMLSISKICPLCVQKVQNPPKFLPKPSQNLPQTLPKRPQIYPEALLEPILSQCLKEARF